MADEYCASYPDPQLFPSDPLDNICACALEQIDKLVDEAVKKRLSLGGQQCPPCPVFTLGPGEDLGPKDPCDKNYVPPAHKCVPSKKNTDHLLPCNIVRRTIRDEWRHRKEHSGPTYENSVSAAEHALSLRYGETPNVQDLVHNTGLTARPGVARLRAEDLFVHGNTRDRIRAELSFEDEPWSEFFPTLTRACSIPKVITLIEQLDEDVRTHEVLKYLSGQRYLQQEMKLLDKYLDGANEKYFTHLRALEDTSSDPAVVSQFDSYEFVRKEWMHKIRQQRELDEMITYQMNRLTPIQGMKTEAYFRKIKAGKRMVATANRSKNTVQLKACRADRLQLFVERTNKAVTDVVTAWGKFGSETNAPSGVCVVLEAMIRNITKRPSEISSDLRALFQTRRVPMFRNMQSFVCTVLTQSEQLTMALSALQRALRATTYPDPRSLSFMPMSAGDGAFCDYFSKDYYSDSEPAMTVFSRTKEHLCSDYPDF